MRNNTKEKVLLLRKEGKTYKEICKSLNLTQATVSYHCSPTAKNKVLSYQKEKRKAEKLGLSFSRPRTRKGYKYSQVLRSKVDRFVKDNNRKVPSRYFKKCSEPFTLYDVIDKFTYDTQCYLTGRPIRLDSSDMSFDHIIPISKGGSGCLDNLGITSKEINYMKSASTVNELLENCKSILEYNGYKVDKILESS